jgi:hypothetical protein
MIQSSKYIVRLNGEWLEISRFPDFKIKYRIESIKGCIVNSLSNESGRENTNLLKNAGPKKYYVSSDSRLLVLLNNGTCKVIASNKINGFSELFNSKKELNL